MVLQSSITGCSGNDFRRGRQLTSTGIWQHKPSRHYHGSDNDGYPSLHQNISPMVQTWHDGNYVLKLNAQDTHAREKTKTIFFDVQLNWQ